jgi:hypothetical protein
MKLLVGIAAAGLCFAATVSPVSQVTMAAVAGTIDQTLSSKSADPFDILGTTRGTYLSGYGAVFTVELGLINAGPLTFYKQTVTPQEIALTRDRKEKNLKVLRDEMRSMMMNASSTLEGMPPNEHVAMEAFLFYQGWENSKGLPRRVLMSAEKQALLDARTAHAGPQELAAVVDEQDQ